MPGQTQQIEALRRQGMGYKAIAVELDLDRDTVRNHCKRVGLGGIAGETDSEAPSEGVCRQCGKPLPPDASKNRKFCSETCRHKWWNSTGREGPRPSAHLQECICANCGKTFTCYKIKARRYCSHECYIRDRFWRLEDGKEPYISPSKSE